MPESANTAKTILAIFFFGGEGVAVVVNFGRSEFHIDLAMLVFVRHLSLANVLVKVLLHIELVSEMSRNQLQEVLEK